MESMNQARRLIPLLALGVFAMALARCTPRLSWKPPRRDFWTHPMTVEMWPAPSGELAPSSTIEIAAVACQGDRTQTPPMARCRPSRPSDNNPVPPRLTQCYAVSHVAPTEEFLAALERRWTEAVSAERFAHEDFSGLPSSDRRYVLVETTAEKMVPEFVGSASGAIPSPCPLVAW
jgi:hypothetical protein